MPTSPGQARASSSRAARSKAPSRSWMMVAFGMPFCADQAGQRARVDAGKADDAARLQPQVEMAGGAVVGRVGDVGPEDAAAHARGGGEVDRLDVLVVDADIADMREGEGDDLAGIGRVGQDLLVAGHRRVEADLADGGAFRAEPHALDHGAVGKHEERGRARVGPGRVGHGEGSGWRDLRGKLCRDRVRLKGNRRTTPVLITIELGGWTKRQSLWCGYASEQFEAFSAVRSWPEAAGGRGAHSPRDGSAGSPNMPRLKSEPISTRRWRNGTRRIAPMEVAESRPIPDKPFRVAKRQRATRVSRRVGTLPLCPPDAPQRYSSSSG